MYRRSSSEYILRRHKYEYLHINRSRKISQGGYDSGALGGNYQEFKIGREIGKYIGEIFKGYACTADVINYNATLYLTERIAHVNKHGYDLAMEIHLNAAHGTGSEVYYKHKSASGKKLAGAISKSIANTFGIRDRGAKVKINPANGTDYFGFVRSCKCESLLIETVFIDTASDRKHVETAAGQRQCAEAIVSAIANFYGIKKKSAPAVKPSEDKPTAEYPSDGKSYIDSWTETETEITQIWTELPQTDEISDSEALSIITERMFKLENSLKFCYNILNVMKKEKIYD